jgi:dethiobiotin synthase
MHSTPFPSLFLTGTDTDVGKTVVTAALLAYARNAGADAVPMKPVQTGCSGSPRRAPDLEFCLRMAGLRVSAAERDRLCPCRFRTACSPHLAAEREGSTLSLSRLTAAWERVRAQHATLLVEGAGGLRVPLNGRAEMIDLAERLEIPALLVVRNRLGALNHALLSLEALRTRGLPVAGYVLVEDAETPRFLRDSNRETLRRIAPERFLGVLPRLKCLDGPAPDPGWFQLETRAFAQGVWTALSVRPPRLPGGEPSRGLRPRAT